ncbi:MAG: hypothetical protein ACKV22_26380 [Bryobacteraceae bacterium]
MKGRTYLEIPGGGSHELPPLLVRRAEGEEIVSLDAIVEMVDAEDMIPSATIEHKAPHELEQLKFDLAAHMAAQYHLLLAHWYWGDSIIEWIRQCEITFETHEILKRFLHPDVWPHASRSSFVDLLVDKHVGAAGVGVERAVGMRLTFRQPPPINCCSNHFLFFLNSPIADSAYQAWAHLIAETPACLPPDRFHFQVHELTLPV